MNRRGFLGTVAAVAAGGCCPKPMTLHEVSAFMPGVESAPCVPPIGSLLQGCIYASVWEGCIYAWAPNVRADGAWVVDFDGTADHITIEEAMP